MHGAGNDRGSRRRAGRLAECRAWRGGRIPLEVVRPTGRGAMLGERRKDGSVWL